MFHQNSLEKCFPIGREIFIAQQFQIIPDVIPGEIHVRFSVDGEFRYFTSARNILVDIPIN